MGFFIDKQTLDDLGIFNRSGCPSIYGVFSTTHTRGGAILLEEIFLYPLSDAEEINERSSIIEYFTRTDCNFPFRSETFDTIELYLRDRDQRSCLAVEDNTLQRRLKEAVGADSEYAKIRKGVIACREACGVMKKMVETMADADNSCVNKMFADICNLLADPEFAPIHSIDNADKLSYERIAEADRHIRFVLYDKMLRLLRFIYLTDLFMSVAKVAREHHFAFAKAHEANGKTFLIRDMFHPLIENARPNSLEIGRDGNIVFLTGANMAGKSTFMKTLGITVYLAQLGFPVPARQMEFVVQQGIFTTINLPDNLSMGYSHFYAEVLRIKKVAELLKRSRKIVVIFDELFRGTNVKDAYDGTVAITKAFSKRNDCTFVISTHIIEAGEELRKYCNNIQYLYLPTRFEGDKLVYTYTATPGITDDRHGMMIINNERIIEILRTKK